MFNKNLTTLTWEHCTPCTMLRQCGAWCNRFAWLGWSVVTAKCMPSASNGMVRLYDTCHYCVYQITHSSNVMYTTPHPLHLLPAPIHSPPTVSIPSGCIALLSLLWLLECDICTPLQPRARRGSQIQKISLGHPSNWHWPQTAPRIRAARKVSAKGTRKRLIKGQKQISTWLL
jgi:hypothetical protein